MDVIKAAEIANNLQQLIDETAKSHKPIIQGKTANAVLLAEADWRAIHETLYLVSIPGMRDAIREGLATDVDEFTKDL